MAESYQFGLHFANARLPKTAGNTWTVNLWAQRVGSTGSVAPISWDYTVTGNESGTETAYWLVAPNLTRIFRVEVYDSTPSTYETGTLYISQDNWDAMDIGQLWDFWADGNQAGAGNNNWSTPRLRLPLKLICSIDQADVAQPLVCNY
ncbi:MAG: hypothetical protein IJH75_03815 [Mogibacterium sp.]|nr:hypothetical protein [Mogibacterium sp.]